MANSKMTVPEVARHFGCPAWAVRNLYTRKILPEPPRAGLVRLIDRMDLPKVEEALLNAGYLQPVGGKPPLAQATVAIHTSANGKSQV